MQFLTPFHQVLLTVDLDGSNIILPSTFVPFAEGNFTLRISSLPSYEMPTVQPVPPWPVAKVLTLHYTSLQICPVIVLT